MVPVSLFAQLSEQAGARLVLRVHRYAPTPLPSAPRRLTQLSLIALVEARYERMAQSDLCSGQPPC